MIVLTLERRRLPRILLMLEALLAAAAAAVPISGAILPVRAAAVFTLVHHLCHQRSDSYGQTREQSRL